MPNYVCVCYVQEDFLLQPEYASLCGDENSLCVKANGYKYKSRVAAAYIIPSHHIRIPCAETECPSFGILIGRHTVSRLELIMYLRSKLSHTHGPCLVNLHMCAISMSLAWGIIFHNCYRRNGSQ